MAQGVHRVDHASEILWETSRRNVAENLISLMGSFIPALHPAENTWWSKIAEFRTISTLILPAPAAGRSLPLSLSGSRL